MDRVDVAIIGGGLIGCATAWRLARAGASVLLIEARTLNAGASGQNAGSLHFQLERRFFEHGEAGAEQAAPIALLNREAVVDWRGLEGELGVDLHVRMRGGLMVAETAEQAALLERKAARERQAGLASRWIDGDAARAIAPYLSAGVVAACHLADEGHADPKRLTPALAQAAQGHGARILQRAPVRDITRAGGRFVVAGDTFRVSTDQILIAAGAWSAGLAALANLHLPIVPVALLMNATERIADAIPHLIQHIGRPLSLKQAGAGNILIGGGWPARLHRGAGGFDLSRRPEIVPASLTGNLRAATETVPMIGSLNLIRSWTGITAITADQLPIVGQVPRTPGLWVAAGGSAFTLGPTFARLLARAIGRGAAPELDIVSPARFGHLNGFMG